MAINNITLQGNITKDLELRGTNGGSVLNFTVASQRDFVDKQTGIRESDFINCVAFNKTAEIIAEHFAKGSEILVQGRMQSGSYENKEGQRVYTTDLIVNNFSFTRGSKQDGQPKQTNQRNNQQNNQQAEQTGFFGAGTTQSNDFKPVDISDSDLPF